MNKERRFYRGDANGNVFVEGADGGDSRELDPRLDLRNHSPTGFAWGYAGSGPAQLALALAVDVLGDEEKALRVYQQYKSEVVALLPQGVAGGPIAIDDVRRDLARIDS